MAINSHRKRIPSCNFGLVALFTAHKKDPLLNIMAKNYSQLENLCAAPWKLNALGL